LTHTTKQHIVRFRILGEVVRLHYPHIEEQTVQHQEGTTEGVKSFDLTYQAWLPDQNPHVILLLVHGLAEHSGRYGNLVDYFVPRGYALYGLDHRGHGRSQGRRGYVEQFSYFVDDLKTFHDIVQSRHPSLPVFMFAHSMGGTIGLSYALQYQETLAGLVLSAPGLRTGESVSPLLITAGKVIARLLPSMGLTTLDSSAISRDPAVVAAYENDPLVYRGKISARLGHELIRTMEGFTGRVSRLHLPLLILHGSADRLIDPDGSRWLYERAGSQDKTLQLYRGYYHEMHNEPEYRRVLADVQSWIAARLPGQGDAGGTPAPSHDYTNKTSQANVH
jgi:alpha-beta hydrolase superfamily lysophospholipase